ncbi:MAG: FHA domain-containing protein [Candidatus Eremiobacteraeota bacterium]|nr:FHA domain-containing protein [Candidatus Eremiobacteraeota bacterium]
MNTVNGFSPLGVHFGNTARPVAPAPVQSTAQPAPPQETATLSGAPRPVCFRQDGQAVYLPKAGEQMTLGRDAKCTVPFQDGEVSRQHARIAEKDGKYYLQDSNSTNGTYLNGQRLEPGQWVEYKPGDSLSLGQKIELTRSPHDLPEQLPQLTLPQNNQAITIGREVGNSLQTSWPDSSRSHAVIQNKDGQNWIMDRGSSNGTLLNGKKIPSQQWVVLNPGAKVQFGFSPQGAFNVAAAEQPLPAAQSLKTAFNALSPQQGQAILARAEFAANPLGFRAAGAAECTKDFLLAQGLEPKTTFECGDTKVHFSQPYSLGDNRAACVGYVENKDGQIDIRAFYRSNSQGLWRAASHAGFNGWIGKGTGEESTNLPIPLQMALHSQAGHQVKNVPEEVARQAFYGSLPVGSNKPPKELEQELHEPQHLGSFQAKLADGYGRPESYRFHDPADAPDFTHDPTNISYSFDHPVHGKVEANCFRSKSGECSFMFYRDSSGRSWLAQMEKSNSPLTSWGTRSDPIEHGDLAMPAVEYRQQIPQDYAGPQITGSYADASAYVHKLPVVADYRMHLGLR